jgi:hypothetical protein
MRSTAIATCFVGLFLLAVGCRTNQNLVLLERENRDLEDALFQVEYDLEVCREENAALREGQATGRRDGRSVGPTLPNEADGSPRDVEQLQLPSVELGPPASPSDQLPEKFRPPDQPATPDMPEAPRFEAPPAILPGPSLAPPGNSPTSGQIIHGEQSTYPRDAPKLPLVDNNLVARVTIDSKHTGGLDADGRLGADGIVAAIQPRGEDGRLLRAAAPVSVVVLDPALPGEAARVARWDFTVDEVARAYNRSSSAQGLQLEMLWPDEPPVNNRLHIFVRYSTGDGREYESDNEIEVDLPGCPAQGWSATIPTDRESQAASRATSDWQRRQSRIQPRGPIEPTPKPLSVVTEPIRTASRPAERTTAPTAKPKSARPTRQLPDWSPNR